MLQAPGQARQLQSTYCTLLGRETVLALRATQTDTIRMMVHAAHAQPVGIVK